MSFGNNMTKYKLTEEDVEAMREEFGEVTKWASEAYLTNATKYHGEGSMILSETLDGLKKTLDHYGNSEQLSGSILSQLKNSVNNLEVSILHRLGYQELMGRSLGLKEAGERFVDYLISSTVDIQDRDKKGMCYVSHDAKMIYFHTPKNCSSTMRKVLGKINSHSVVADNYFDLSDAIKKKYKKVSIIRDPIDRTVSSFIEVTRRAYTDNLNLQNYDFMKQDNLKDAFLKFVDELERQDVYSPDVMDQHVRGQAFFLTDQDGNDIDFDYVLDCDDNFKKYLSEMLQEMGVKFDESDSPHERKTDDDFKNNIREILEKEPELLDRLYKIYHRDFELLDRIKIKHNKEKE
jgi:hypothetical protein